MAWMVYAMVDLLKSFAWDAFERSFYAQVVGLSGRQIDIAMAVIIKFDALADP